VTVALWAGAGVAYLLSLLRWLRVAQREHYLFGTVTRFAGRWWRCRTGNLALFAVALGGLLIGLTVPAGTLVSAVALMLGPIGLSVRGSTAPLRWTPRLRRLAGLTVLFTAILVALSGLVSGAVRTLAWSAFLLPLLIDGALAAGEPIERRLSQKFVDRARQTLAQVAPLVVAITGSYGKTSTKSYLARLLRDGPSTVASPASFNNRLGLARSINEHLASGTQVFIAEMGTYGKGEIADMCAWMRPAIGVITAIGPVHLERFGSLEAVVEAKSEILATASTAVLNIDHPLLADLAGRLDIEVVRCSTKDATADVFVDGRGSVFVSSERVAGVDVSTILTDNLACAVGAAVAAGATPASLAGAMGDLQSPQHRRTLSKSELGFSIIDDTYNSNPAGARSALAMLEHLGTSGRRVMVTPGMVELGKTQHAENHALASFAADLVSDLVIVGRTNRSALMEGTAGREASVIVVDSRKEAVEWVRENLADGDVVLYENDLPDHYP
jgi:UDP-N-acetylmuramoyl-tripeptide--D-alanyl-D-alanine ligase